MVWFLLLKFVDLTCGLRVSLDDEILGADLVQHGVNSGELAGTEDEQRQYVRLMTQGSTRGEGDGSLDSHTHSKDVPVSRMTSLDSFQSETSFDPEMLYKQFGLLDTRKRTHVFGACVHKIQNVPAVMDYLNRLKLRRFSDEFVTMNKAETPGRVNLRRSSSLEDVRTVQNDGSNVSSSQIHVNLGKSFLPGTNHQVVPSVSGTVDDNTDSIFSNNLGFLHESQDLDNSHFGSEINQIDYSSESSEIDNLTRL